MNAEILQSFVQELAAAVAKEVKGQLSIPLDDPLLTCKQAGDRVGLSDTTIRHLVNIGAIKKAPDLAEIRIRQSVLDAYGK
jgi:hypothetical protein